MTQTKELLPKFSQYLIDEINGYQHMRDGWREGSPNYEAYDLIVRELRKIADKYLVFEYENASLPTQAKGDDSIEGKIKAACSQALFAGYANGSLKNIDFMKVHDEWLSENTQYLSTLASPALYSVMDMEKFAEWAETNYAQINSKWVSKDLGILVHGSPTYYAQLVEQHGITTSELLTQFISSLKQ